MNRILVLSLLFLISLVNLAGQDEKVGIIFEDSPWASLLTKAKLADKLIFVDAYTSWCGPCRTMAREVFTHSTIADFYNENFINVHLNAEEGEGLQFARKYRIRAYPSLLFINAEGEVVHQATGFQDVPAFKRLGEEALSPAGSLLDLNRQYKSGERSPEFLRRLIMAKYNAMEEDYMEVAQTYMRTQKDWSTLENMQLIYTLIEDPATDWFDYMVDHRSDFDLLFGRQAVATKLQSLFLKKPLGKTGDAMAEVERFYSKVYPDLAPKLIAHFKMNYYRTAGDMEAFAKAADTYLSRYAAQDSDELNNIAWTFYEHIEDKKLLQKAVRWAQQSVALARGYHNLDTLAHLYYSVGKKGKAKKVAKEAVTMAKTEGFLPTSTLELLEYLEGKLICKHSVACESVYILFGM